jgi:ribosomal protein L11 methyltransferase
MFQRLSSHLILLTLGHSCQAEPLTMKLKMGLGEAFPPTHPTTRLCLDLLREVLAVGSVNRLVDVGCGTGVLGLAAAALGVPLVVGLDIAQRAAAVTRENARDNALAGSLMAVQGSTECVKVRFDLVVANLPWEVQLEKGPELDRLAAPGGALMLSGFRDNQESRLRENYQNLGWSLHQRRAKDFWHPELPPDLSFTWVAWLLQRNR